MRTWTSAMRRRAWLVEVSAPKLAEMDTESASEMA